MLRNFRLGLCQFAAGADKPANLQLAQQMIEEAVAKGAQVVMLPECFNSPYHTKHFPNYAEEIPGNSQSSPTVSFLQSMARTHQIYLIGGSIPEIDSQKYYNTCICLNPDGEIQTKHRKVHLFDINVPGKITFYESEILSPGSQATIFRTEFCKIGVGICYDLRMPEYAYTLGKSEEVGLLAYPGNFNVVTGEKHWEVLLRARAVDNQIFVAACSQARDPEGEYLSWGHSMLVNPWGQVLNSTTHLPQVVIQDVDFGVLQENRTSLMNRQHKKWSVYDMS